jgi:hypothetical protein
MTDTQPQRQDSHRSVAVSGDSDPRSALRPAAPPFPNIQPSAVYIRSSTGLTARLGEG